MFFVINSYVFRASHTHRPQCPTGAEMAILRWFYNVFWKAIITTPSDRPSESSICNIRCWRHLYRNIDIFDKIARNKNMHFSLRVLFLSARMNLRIIQMTFSFDFWFSGTDFSHFFMHSRADLEKSREASFAAMAILCWFYNVFWTSMLRQAWH